jgi:protein-L-isoaspartate(D-aspartate) O-methyltransferase
MAWQCTGKTNAELIDNLAKGGLVKDKIVIQALKAVNRAHYVLDASQAYVDSPQMIGYNATISAPHMHAMCLELLVSHLKPGSKALDVGSGSGYLVAAMSQLVGEKGHVYGVEHIPELVKWSQGNLAKDDQKIPNWTIQLADGRQGLADKGPYDCIHVGAAAAEVPQALLSQLKVGGRLVIPVGADKGNQELKVIDRKSEKEWLSKNVCGVRYVPLTAKDSQLGK